LPTGVEGKAAVLLENEFDLVAALLFMKRGCDIFPISFKLVDISLLQKYSSEKLQLRMVKNWDEIESFCTQKRLDVLVSGQTLEQYKKLLTSILILRPLIGYTFEEVQQMLLDYS
jgi:adenylyl- and sulfurtransferase ThiI